MEEAPEREARERAIGLLARREHSMRELARKLRQRDYPREVVAAVIEGLAAEGLVSDGRFAEEYARSRRDRGYGPLRIRAELAERGVDDALAEPHLSGDEAGWTALARSARRRRFGASVPQAPRERQRQQRFLAQRGFTFDQIRRAVEDRDED